MYEIFEHTADFGIRAKAPGLEPLFVEAARGLFSILLANPDAVRSSEAVAIGLVTDDVESLLHDWLDELLYTFSARHLVLRQFDVRIEEEAAGSWRLSGTAWGELIDPSRHEIETEVKAITWHALRIARQGDDWLAEVIVDV